MSLREEIEQAIHTCIANPQARVNSDKSANATKAALYLIEKRIDERIEYLKNRKPIMVNFKIDELEKVKEMLK